MCQHVFMCICLSCGFTLKIILFISLQISSFSVSPNYEIIFFSSEIYRVVNILDCLDGKVGNFKAAVEKFKVESESNISVALKLLF